MRIILLRHGESVANTNKGVLSDDATPLTELGRRQAARTVEFLKKHYNVKRILASPAVRTQQTAKIVGDGLGIKKITTINNLKEGDNGILKGIARNEIVNIPKIGSKIDKLVSILDKTEHIDITKEDKKFIDADEKLSMLIGGESLGDMRKRAKLVLKEIMAMPGNGDILVVSHNGFIRIMLNVMFHIHNEGLGHIFAKDASGKNIKNCHVSVINRKNKVLELTLYTEHLNE